jgi:hypothetical protein
LNLATPPRPRLPQRRKQRAWWAWIFYFPLNFMLVFFAMPKVLTRVWSVFERTMF